MTLREEQLADAKVMVDPDEFGETVTLHLASGGTRTVNVAIERFERESGHHEGVLIAAAHLSIIDDATAGISSYDPALEITFAMREGGVPQRYKTKRVVSKDAMFWIIEVTE